MFVKFHGITQYVSDGGGEVMLSIGGEKATAMEAAECISRLVINGDPLMMDANSEFINTWGAKVSAPDVTYPVPNQHMKDFSTQRSLREMREANEYHPTGTFDHLFSDDGSVK